MSKYSIYQENAHAELSLCAQLLEHTFAISKDPKVLIAVLHHLKKAQDACISFVGYLQGTSLSLDDFVSYAQETCSAQEIDALIQVHQLCKNQEESDVEFRRKESYVLCNDDYELSSITEESLRTYVEATHTLTKKILR